MAADPTPRQPWLSPWDLLPLAGALALALALPRLMDGLPDPIPTHFDARGAANGWTPKAAFPWFALGLPLGTWGLILLSARAFVGSNQDPDGRKSAALAPLRALVTLGFLGLMVGGLLIPRHGQRVLGWMIGGFLALVALGVVLMVRDMKRLLDLAGTAAGYRWGLFYANADDPRLWVPKRLGLGWTLNFAHGRSWAILLLLLSPLLGLALLRFLG